MKGRDYILVALDVETREEALRLYELLKGEVGGFKIGLRLFTREGPDLVRKIQTAFLDLKYHDIPKTVADAVYAAASLGAKMINVHCLGGDEMMTAAAQSVAQYGRTFGSQPLLLGVTILTSMDVEALARLGISPAVSVAKRVARLAFLAHRSGLDGVVCSPQEISAVRNAVPDDEFLIVTPGIRGEGDVKADQKRTATAAQAVAWGANRIVVGRPITSAADPVWVARTMAQQIDESVAKRSLA